MVLSMKNDIISDKDIDGFMTSPLVQWLKGLSNSTTTQLHTFQDLVDGIFLHEVACILDEEFFAHYLNNVEEHVQGDTDKQALNLNLLLDAISTYYKEHLQSILLLQPPVPAAAVHKPLLEVGLESIRQFIVLLLGISVKCKDKERHVQYMRTLDASTQISLMSHIQEVLDSVLEINLGVDFSNTGAEDTGVTSRELIDAIHRVISERDTISRHLANTLAPKSNAESNVREDGASVGTRNGAPQSISEFEHRLKLLRDELEDKTKLHNELMDENRKLRIENAELSSKIKELYVVVEETQILQDELDEWRQKETNSEQMRREIAKYKEKLEDHDYLQKRLEDIQEQLSLSTERNERLRVALRSMEERNQSNSSAESKNRMLEAQIRELTQTQEKYHVRLRESNAKSLRIEEENKLLQQELDRYRDSTTSTAPTRAYGDDNQKQFLDLTTQLTSCEMQVEEMMKQLEESKACLSKEQERSRQLEKEIEQQNLTHSEKERSIDEKLEDVMERGVRLKDQRIKTLEVRLKEIAEQNEALKQDVAQARRHIDLLRTTRRDAGMNTPLTSRHGTFAAGGGKALPQLLGSPLAIDSSRPKSAQTPQESASSSVLATLQAELSAIKIENSKLKESLDLARTDVATNKMVTTVEELNNLKSVNEMLTTECEKLRRRARTSERESIKLRASELKNQDKVKMLTKVKTKLEHENTTLLEQLNKLLVQNQDLLVKSLKSSSELKNKDEQLQLEKHSRTKEREELTDQLEQAQRRRPFFNLFKRKNRDHRSQTPDPSQNQSDYYYNSGSGAEDATSDDHNTSAISASSLSDLKREISFSDPDLHKHTKHLANAAAVINRTSSALNSPLNTERSHSAQPVIRSSQARRQSEPLRMQTAALRPRTALDVFVDEDSLESRQVSTAILDDGVDGDVEDALEESPSIDQTIPGTNTTTTIQQHGVTVKFNNNTSLLEDQQQRHLPLDDEIPFGRARRSHKNALSRRGVPIKHRQSMRNQEWSTSPHVRGTHQKQNVPPSPSLDDSLFRTRQWQSSIASRSGVASERRNFTPERDQINSRPRSGSARGTGVTPSGLPSASEQWFESGRV